MLHPIGISPCVLNLFHVAFPTKFPAVEKEPAGLVGHFTASSSQDLILGFGSVAAVAQPKSLDFMGIS